MISASLRKVIPCISVLKSAGIDFEQLWQGQTESAPPFRVQRLLTGWFERAREKGLLAAGTDPQAVATAFQGALQARPFLAHVASIELPPTESDPYLEQLVDVLWRGLAPKEAR